MSFAPLPPLRKLFAVLLAAVAIVLLAVTGFVAHTLHQSRQHYYSNAEETSRNLAISLENFMRAYFREVDLSLRRAALEFRNLHADGRYDAEQFSAYLRGLKERIPHARAIRGADAAGQVIYGEDIQLNHPLNLNIREFFQRAKTERELIFGVPVRSRISDELVLPLVYPLRTADGQFGGAAYVTLNNSTLTELFSSLNIGAHGIIILLDRKHRLLHRYPEVSDLSIGGPVPLSSTTAAILRNNQRHALYTVHSKRDGLERVYSLEGVGEYPIYVMVGLSSDDFLAPWHKEVRNALSFLAVLYLLAASLLYGVRMALRKQDQTLAQLVEKDGALQGSLAALTASELRWRSLTEGLPQMIWTITPELSLTYLSHHWQEYTGLPLARLMGGTAWRSFVHPDDHARLEAAWERAIRTRGEFRCDSRLQRHDGAWRVFDGHGLPQFDADGTILCWVGSSTDMTETREAHAQLLRAKDQALAAGRAKSDFVANMSHEIRTPMNAVLGMLQLLRQTPLDVRQRDYSGKAETAARALLGLLNDILDFSKVEAGKLQLERHPFSLDKLLRDLSVIMSANAGSKQLEVLFQIDPGLPAWLCGDALRLQQILLNLTGNAIKFTDQGEVVLSARLAGRDGEHLQVAFAIRDTGIGIAPDHAQHIFDGFSQAEASTARRYGGTGLGLAISQRLVRLMGGTLRVDSTLGVGSCFDFSIALDAAQPEALAAPAAMRPEQLQGLDCLVVDDNLHARQVMAEMASSFGWRVDTASTGQDALTAVARRGAEAPYDAIFIDWHMPTQDGWQTSVQIRQLLGAGRQPRIIMVTAHDRELLAQKQAAQQDVLDGILIKPVTASMLFDAVADATLPQGAPATAAAALSPLPRARPLAGVRLLLVEDNPTNQQVARELLGYQGADVTVAACGKAAIDAIEDSTAASMPHLILMDIQMPDMDGYAATGVIRALLGSLAPPIVAMTANAMASDRAAALDCGMVDHVGKPFDLEQLTAVILQHARRGAAVETGAGVAPAQAAAANNANHPSNASNANNTNNTNTTNTTNTTPATTAAASAGAARSSTVAVLDSAAALKRMGGLQELYQHALRGFVGQAGELAQQLQDARHAERIDDAKATLHVLKGLAGTVGANHLAGLAALAELAASQDGAAVATWQQVAAVLTALTCATDAVQQLLGQAAAAPPAEALPDYGAGL